MSNRKPSAADRIFTQTSVDADPDGFQDLLDSLPDSYFEADTEGIIQRTNLALCENLGYRRKKDVVGLHVRDLLTSDAVRIVYRNFARLRVTRTAVPRFECSYRRSDGRARPAEFSISPIIRVGKMVGTRGIVRDIEDRIEVETALRAARDEAVYRATALSTVNRVAGTVSRSLDMDEVLQSVCKELTAIFPVRNAGVALITPDRQNMEVVAFYSPDPDEPSALGMILPFAGNPSSQEVIRTRRPLVLQDAQTDPRAGSLAAISRRRGTHAIMIVPLLTRGDAIGTIGMPAADPFYVFSEAEIALAETIASQIAAAIENARLHTKTEKALTAVERELEIGRQIQSGFLPGHLPSMDGWEIATEFDAAKQVAGDFFDVFRIGNTSWTVLVVADVCDKGVGAALFMVLFRTLLRAFFQAITLTDAVRDQLHLAVVNTNNYIADNHADSNMFATMFVGVINGDTGTLHYINGGHEPPVVLDRNGAILKRLTPTGPAVGMFRGMEFSVGDLRIGPGECLVGFTDGTTDARDDSGDIFSEDRLLEAIAHPWTSLHSMLFELRQDLRTHIGDREQFDDITLLALRRDTESGTVRHAICRPAEIQVLPAVREFVESAADYCGLDPDGRFAFVSAADEICTNIIQHGYPEGGAGFFSLFFEIAEDRTARLTITDDGVHFPPELAKDPDLETSWQEREVGGLGIFLVREQMDSVQYTRLDNGVNQLIIERSLDRNDT